MRDVLAVFAIAYGLIGLGLLAILGLLVLVKGILA